MKYTPPNISLFKKYGRGYLALANDAVDFSESALVHSHKRLLENPERSTEPRSEPEEDFVEAYAYWTMADDLLKRLERMKPEEREEQLALDTKPERGITFDEVSRKHADLTGLMVAWEERNKETVYPVIDRQLQRRLDTWEQLLERAEKDQFEPITYGEDFESLHDFCGERDIIEYAAMGIKIMQIRESGRLQPLPYLDTFIQRRLKLDERFRKALNGRYIFAPWADPKQFWWHYPS